MRDPQEAPHPFCSDTDNIKLEKFSIKSEIQCVLFLFDSLLQGDSNLASHQF